MAQNKSDKTLDKVVDEKELSGLKKDSMGMYICQLCDKKEHEHLEGMQEIMSNPTEMEMHRQQYNAYKEGVEGIRKAYTDGLIWRGRADIHYIWLKYGGNPKSYKFYERFLQRMANPNKYENCNTEEEELEQIEDEFWAYRHRGGIDQEALLNPETRGSEMQKLTERIARCNKRTEENSS